MDVKSTRRSHRATRASAGASQPATKPESAASTTAPARSPAGTPAVLEREDGAPRLPTGEVAAHMPRTASPAALWGARAGRERPDELRGELHSVEGQIADRSQHLDNQWRHGDGGFRRQVLRELLKSGDLTADQRAALQKRLTRLDTLAAQRGHAHTKKEQTAIAKEETAVANDAEKVVKSKEGGELELLQAVERADGEAGEEGSLSSLIDTWRQLYSQLTASQSLMQDVGHAAEKQSAHKLREVEEAAHQAVVDTRRQSVVSALRQKFDTRAAAAAKH